MEQIEIHTEFIKLDAFLKLCGAAASGGQAKEIILRGTVFVNGASCTARGKKLRPGDAVVFEGKEYGVFAKI